jgi:glycine/D-amino acid oxidase-like deaminating enzyme
MVPLYALMKTSRRSFLASTGAGALGLAAGCSKVHSDYPGQIVGAAAAVGHRLRDGQFPAPTETRDTGFVIVGGGIAGLSAARRLIQRGSHDFLLLELDRAPGGNAACGRNAISAYPWGAHYVPLPNEDSREVLSLFEELGIIRSYDASGLPVYDEETLCSDPMERLFDAGRWQEGLLPQIGITSEDHRQYDTFFARMLEFRDARGSDGQPAFTIPLDLSSRDPELLALDSLTMAQWMRGQGFDSAPLLWHVDYCCRDDYGAGLEHISAWAGVHYFASRRGRAANADADAVVTWPEGNGWLASQLTRPLGERVQSGCVVFNLEQNADTAFVDFFDVTRQQSIRLRARGVVCAAPRFVAARILHGLAPLAGLEYSPWMVANITLDQVPGGNGAAVAWDNVARASRSLGYVVATHQDVRRVPCETVLTHYWPLDGTPPAEERQRALGKSHREWCDLIVADLASLHPGIERHIQQIDVWLWGHGMIRPVPGFIWGEARARMIKPHGRIFFAHSDMSGISIFEEAFTHGFHAADRLLDQYG